MWVLWTILAAWAGPTVAIADLSNRTGDPAFDGAGPGVAGLLVSRFQGSGVVDVVDRDAMEVLLIEQRLSVDGLTDPRKAVRAGKLLGADYLVLGELFSVQLPTVTIALRVIDTETGENVVAEDIVGDAGADGGQFFTLIDTLASRILASMQVQADAGRLERGGPRGLDGVLRYGEDLVAVNLEHPKSLYRQSNRDFDRDYYARNYWLVVDSNGRNVPMPKFAHRVGDADGVSAYIDRVRRQKTRFITRNVLTGAYGVAGAGMFVGYAGREPNLQMVGAGVVAVCGLNFGLNAIVQAFKRSRTRRLSPYYEPGEADRWIQKHNRALE